MYSNEYSCLPSVTCFPTSLQHLVNLFSRLANDNIGYIDWDPYIPKVCVFFFHRHYIVYYLLVLSFVADAPMCVLTFMIWAHGVYFMANAACPRNKLSSFLVAPALG